MPHTAQSVLFSLRRGVDKLTVRRDTYGLIPRLYGKYISGMGLCRPDVTHNNESISLFVQTAGELAERDFCSAAYVKPAGIELLYTAVANPVNRRGEAQGAGQRKQYSGSQSNYKKGTAARAPEKGKFSHIFASD